MRIFDTFLFDGELTLLEHRLTELYDAVDVFVLVEAARTYRDEPKPLLFSEHRDRFAWAACKIRAIALHQLGRPDATPRERAAVQRNAVMLALRDAEPDDVVLILDADEIPSRSVLARLREAALTTPSRLAMTRHYEFVDIVGPRSPCCPTVHDAFPHAVGRRRPGAWSALDAEWHGRSGVAVRYRDLVGDPAVGVPACSPYDARFRMHDVPVLADAGRHFTSVDPAARLERKLGRVFHAEYADSRGTSPAHLRRCRAYAVHHRGWWYGERPSGPLPDDVARLAHRSPDLLAPPALPAFWRRRLARTWAWLRLSPRLPAALVRGIDRHYEVLLPALGLPLLVADLLRALAARRGPRRAPVAPARSAAVRPGPRPTAAPSLVGQRRSRASGREV